MERKRFIRNYYNKERTYNEKHNVKGDENTWNEALLIKSSKLLMARSFSMSIIWKMLTGLLLSLSLMFTTLFQNQVEWILPEFFSLQHLYPSWFFSWHMGSDMKSLPENFSWYRSSDLFWRFFLVTITLCLSLLNLNFTITDSVFFKRWQACSSPGLTSCPA